MTRRRAIAYLIMGGLIIKHLLSNEYGLFDRLLELGVFILIAYEVGLTILHRRKNKRYGKIVAVLSDFMFKGQTLAQSTPNPGYSGAPISEEISSKIMEWETAVGDWRTEVAQYLNERSSKAASAFLLNTVSESHITNLVHPLEGWSFHLSGHQREAYQALLGFLNNLQRLIENPEVYF